ncbi:hypothetical protein QJQ45_028995 [Haematococcus lacustris]|nr:hypothetical protein QJQ45_028995 [Haematococcus lacustris]
MATKDSGKHKKDPGTKQKASRSPQGKQRQERRDGWTTRRRQLEEEMAELSMERHNHAKQLVVFFGAATIGTGGGWGANAVLRAYCKVVCRPRGAGQWRGRVVLVNEHRTSRVSSAVNGKQPCEEELNKLSATRPAGWKPLARQVDLRLVRPAWSQERDQPVRGLMWCPVVAPRKPPQAPGSSQAATQPAASKPGPSTPPPAKRSKPAAEPTKGGGKAKGKAAKAKPAPQPGRWLDRDCNAALNMQRIGESRHRVGCQPDIPFVHNQLTTQVGMDESATDPPVRRKLNLKPRDENAAQKAEEARLARSGSNPFGAALPREAVLAHRTGKTEQSILREEGRREQLRLRLTPQQAEEKEGLEALVKEAKSQVLAAESAPEAEQAALKQQLESRQAALDNLIDQFAKAALLAAEKGPGGGGEAAAGSAEGPPGYMDQPGSERMGGGGGRDPAGCEPVSYALCDNPSLLLVPSQRLVPLKASNDRSVGMAGPRADVRSPRSPRAQCCAAARRRGASCKKTRRKLWLRAEIHSQLRVIASLFVLRNFLTCLVGYPTPGFPSAPQPPAVQPPHPPDAPPLPPRAPAQPPPAQPASMECDIDSDSESDCGSEPEPVRPPSQRRCSARLAALAPAAPTSPPLPLDCEDPLTPRRLKDFCKFFANPNFETVYNQLQRRLVRPRQNRHPMLMPVFEDPSNQALLAKLQGLCSIKLTERFVKLYAKAARAQLGWSGEEAQLFIKMACGYGINANSSELKAATLDKGHVADMIKEFNKHPRLLGMKKQGSLQDTLPLPCRMRHAVHVCRWLEQWQQPHTPPLCQVNQSAARGVGWFDTKKLRNKGFAFERLVDTDGVSGCVHYTRPLLPPPAPPPAASSSSSSHPSAAAAAAHAVGLPHIGKGIAEMREFVFDTDTQIGVGIDPGVTQAVSAASGVWDPESGQLVADRLAQWKLTRGQVKHASGLNNARRDTERWLAPIKPHLQHLAAASSACTSLEANLKHITVTLATWDAVWEVYLDPKWARQRLRLYGAQDRALEQFFNKLEEEMAELSMERHNHAKQLVVFFGAATIGTGGGWGADAVLRACCKVVCRPRGTGQRRGRVVLVDEHRTSRVSSAVNGKQPCEEELNKLSATRPAGWKPLAGQVEQRLVRSAWSQERPTEQPVSHTASSLRARAPHSPSSQAQQAGTEPTKGKGKAKGKAAKAKPTPQPGRWLDRDCNAALNMWRIGESRWRPLELCWWPEQGALPAKGKEYPGLGYKRLRDKPPQAQQQQPAEAQ